MTVSQFPCQHGQPVHFSEHRARVVATSPVCASSTAAGRAGALVTGQPVGATEIAPVKKDASSAAITLLGTHLLLDYLPRYDS